MNVTLSNNAAAFSKNLIEYCKASSKGFSDALAAQGGKFSQELYNQFRAIRPPRGSIFDAAASRGFRVSRKSSTYLVRLSGNLSQRAVDRAKDLLGGQKSDYFKVMANGSLAPMRFGKRGSHKVITGGKTGWRALNPARGGLQAYQLTPSQLVASLSKYKSGGGDVRRLNFRALATYFELRYRQRAGGIMAFQWLNKTYKWSAKGTFKTTQLVQRSATGLVIGTVAFETFGDTLTAIVFTGNVPGTPEQAESHGILDKVFSARAADLLQAIAKAHAKAVRQKHLE
jgi:hypothetical protein